MQRWMTAVREVILRSVKSRVVIFVDEIDAVRGLPFSTDEFFAGIRQMYNERTSDPELERITFCLLGVAKPSDLIRNVNTTPFNIGHRMELTDFTEQEAEPLLGGLGRDDRAGRKLLRRVLWWTGGHPYLTQRMCATIAADDSVVSDADVDRVCTDTFLSSRARERDDNLLFVRERVLRSEADRASLLDIYERVHGGKAVRDDDTNPLIDTLRLAGLVTVRDNRLAVRNRIYASVFDRKWITANMPDAELRRQQRAFHKGVARAAGIAAIVLGIVAVFFGILHSDEEQAVANTYAANMTQVQQEFDLGDFGAGTSLLKRWWELVKQDEVKPGFEWNWLWARYSGESATTYWGHWDEVHSVAISPNGRWVVTAGADSTVRMFDLQPDLGGFGPVQPCLTTTSVATPTKSLSRSSSSADQTNTVPPAPPGGAPVQQDPAKRCFPLLRALVVDQVDKGGAKLIDHGKVDNEVERLVRKTDLDPKNHPLPGVLPGVMSVQFSPDGLWIAIATGSWRSQQTAGQLYLWSTADPEKIIHVPANHKKTIDAVVFRNHSEFATAGEDNTAEFWRFDPKTGKPEKLESSFTAPDSVSRGMNAAAFSPDGRYYAMVFGDGHLAVKDMEDPAAAVRISPSVVDVSGLMSVVFYDDKTILVGSRDGNLLQVDCGTLKPRSDRAVKSGQGLVTSLTLSGDKNFLITTGSNSTVLVWRLKRDGDSIVVSNPSSNPSMLRGHRAEVYSAAITPDQKLIVSGSADHSVRFWERNGDLNGASGSDSNASYASHFYSSPSKGAVSALAFSPDGGKLVYIRGASTEKAQDDQTEVSFYDSSWRSPHVEFGHQGFGSALAYSVDGRHVATAATDGSVLLWDAQTYTWTKLETPAGKSVPITALTFSGDGTLAGSGGGSLLFWRPDPSGSGTGVLKLVKVVPPMPGNEKLTRSALAFSPDSKWLAVCTSRSSGNTVDILDADDLDKAAGPQLTGAEKTPHGSGRLLGSCDAVAFSPDGKWLAAGTNFREIAVWSTGNWKRVIGEEYRVKYDQKQKTEQTWLAAPPEASAAINTVAFSPDNHLLAYGTADSNIVLWDVVTRRTLPTIAMHSGGVLSIAFSPNGRCLASGTTDGTLRITPTAKPDLTNLDWIPFGSFWSSCVGSP
jgi:WD40 repeat protein